MLRSVNHKTLWLVRHAKSSWDSDIISDHDRPLNKRGLSDAPLMGSRLARIKTSPQLMICSSATRAQTTAKLIAKEIGYNCDRLEIDSRIYGAGLNGMIEIIQHLDGALDQIMLIGHNPDMTDTINWLSDSHIDNCPTCSIAELQVTTDSWRDFSQGSAELIRFDYPKKPFNH
ncbi:MAG: histidine phosphatase family protein [Gammaproteobacteria bacterium]|nr:histidine phosphatase family protein [Gammaproteobacteria bacterium]